LQILGREEPAALVS